MGDALPALVWMAASARHRAAGHRHSLASLDFFVVPTATFRLLFVLLILAHDRRRILHFNVTSSPNAAWTAQQVVQTFPEETAARYLLRDRDGIYGTACTRSSVTSAGTGMRQRKRIQRTVVVDHDSDYGNIILEHRDKLEFLSRFEQLSAPRYHAFYEKDPCEPGEVEQDWDVKYEAHEYSTRNQAPFRLGY